MLLCNVSIENDDPHESEELELHQFERLENLLRCVLCKLMKLRTFKSNFIYPDKLS